MLFLGNYEYTMEDRGRVPVPTAFRAPLGTGIIMTPAPQHCLRVYTTETYERAAASVLRRSANTAAGQRLRRAFFSRTFEGEVDRAGRILVPSALRQRLGLDGAVTVIGCGDYIELWDRTLCNAELGEAFEQYPDLLTLADIDD